MLGMRVRLASAGDAEATRAIYNHEVLGTTATFDLVPRTLEDQRSWLADHAGAHPVVVATAGENGEDVVDGDDVVGFASLSPYRSRPAYATTVEDSVYVRADQRGRGVGRLLLQEIVGLAGAHGFHSVVARIADSNQASVGLHRACGFALVGVEREVGRKFGRWLDVAIVQRMLG